MNVLHIITSPHASESISLKLGNAIVDKLVAGYPQATITVADLAKEPFPHLDYTTVKAIRTPKDQQTEEQKELLTRSDAAVAQLTAANVIVVSMPLFNFGIPSALKTWLDHVVRAGITFRYGENGPEGLLTGKKAYIAIASGGVYSQGPMQPYDHAIPYLKSILSFIGITDVAVTRAEGIGIPALRETALDKAIEEITV